MPAFVNSIACKLVYGNGLMGYECTRLSIAAHRTEPYISLSSYIAISRKTKQKITEKNNRTPLNRNDVCMLAVQGPTVKYRRTNRLTEKMKKIKSKE